MRTFQLLDNLQRGIQLGPGDDDRRKPGISRDSGTAQTGQRTAQPDHDLPKREHLAEAGLEPLNQP
ncbi:hypothetical protein ABI59_21910 [Acidobacteria bacterium Mor1]|nr:hypothetical protein ABI59_21910 [Acidobacteria bacterium Mor1]